MRATRWAGVLPACALIGCAAPTSHKQQVSELAAAFAKVRTSVELLAEDERRSLFVNQARLGLGPGYRLVVPRRCEAAALRKQGFDRRSFDCVARIDSAAAGESRVVYDPAGPNARVLIARLVDYGDGLARLAAAEDLSALSDALGKAGAAIGKLRNTASPGAAAEPLGSIAAAAGWVAGRYLDQQRFEALRQVVGAADGHVEKAASLLSREASRMQESVVMQRAAMLGSAQLRIEVLRQAPQPDAAALATAAEQFVGDSIALQAFATTDMGRPFAAMRKAHAALLESLEHPAISAEFVFSTISAFLDQAEALKDGIEKSRER